MSKKRINTDNPADIDGDPSEVRTLIQTQLAQLAKELSAYIEDCVTQLSNAERTVIISANPAMSPEELAEQYESLPYAGKLARLDGAAKVFLKLADDIAKEKHDDA